MGVPLPLPETGEMKKLEMKVYKERLVLLRARLRGDVTAMAKSALSRSVADNTAPESGSEVGDSFDQESTLSLMQNEEESLSLIEDALERIEDGVYGQCAECEGKIPKTRLNAIPYTPYCVKCASKLEANDYS